MKRPENTGLYVPEFEHDACGVGLIGNLKGQKSHDIILKGLRILENLTHRGAAAADNMTGDGAGILIQTPHKFIAKIAVDANINLPNAMDYGTGLVFLPRKKEDLNYMEALFRQITHAEGQVYLGMRDVPVDSEKIGEIARRSEPVIRQVFIGKGGKIKDQSDFERKLYIIRKLMEREVRNSQAEEKHLFYVPSLSSRTIVYKGMFLAHQVSAYYTDLQDTDMESGLAMVHQRYSTNTFPSWDLAHPFRFLSHNGEINTLRGNINWMKAREPMFESPLFGDDIRKIIPVLTPNASDSAILDNALELLYHTGRSLPKAIMMMIPEAWENHDTMSENKKGFYEYSSTIMEPWDGPASIPFTDGEVIGAVLDRNGLRPSRYTVTKDGMFVMSSESGVVDIQPENVESKGRLQPGRMFLVDTAKGRIVPDAEIKEEIAGSRPYSLWVKRNLVPMDNLPLVKRVRGADFDTLHQRQKMFGFTREDLDIIIEPMAVTGQEPVGSMGSDFPIAILSDRPQLLFNYFHQLFAQVTNPPLDAIREKLVTSLSTTIGTDKNLFEETEEACHQLKITSPVLTNKEMAKIKGADMKNLFAKSFPIIYRAEDGTVGIRKALESLFIDIEKAVNDGVTIVVLSDRRADKDNPPIPALIAVAGLHHYLIRREIRGKCGIVLESGEPREVHHFATLFGYGASAVNPYLVFETIEDMINQRRIKDMDLNLLIRHYIKAVDKGILKVMSKMGISTLSSYRGAQIFEAIGLNKAFIDEFFTNTPSRIGGIGLEEINQESLYRHRNAFPDRPSTRPSQLDIGGVYKWRRDGERHLFNPYSIAWLQQATRDRNENLYLQYAEMINDQAREIFTIRGMLDFKETSASIPLKEVESWESIVKRFKTGAMSYGSLSQEAHETLAIAMNRLGAKSNSGEGGENAERFIPLDNGDSKRSEIKQVASGRFGVTSNYLINASELQIKMAQGAKPGEGGQLPSEKVYPWIAEVRHSTPYVSLISPPPHHDIYSIEDIAQLIHDLKNSNKMARISVKLVSEVGVGTVAAGLAKGKADVILISGWDGGTGASPQTSLKHAGLPWELGLAEAHQTLVMNELRSRVVLETDGSLKTGRDVAIAALLGAEEFGFATAPLVVLGCVMMRACHLNSCPVGVATQDPELRSKFTGKPEHVINFFYFIAQELRRIMASLGIRTMDEMIGRSDLLKMRDTIIHEKAKHLDLSSILKKPQDINGIKSMIPQDHGLDKALDNIIIEKARPALDRMERVEFGITIRNTNRTVGTLLSSEISRKYGEAGLPEDTIIIHAQGSAGQSFGAFGAKGVSFHIKGEANDFLGKGLSGAKIAVSPPDEYTSDYVASENIIIGNVALYGATSGELYVRGIAGERFGVRNSGARAVVEGVGDHGCEYMTGGRVVVLGATGRNFAAGMSGGIAYVYDINGDFSTSWCNQEMVDLEILIKPDDINELRSMIENHFRYTRSKVAGDILTDWSSNLHKFIKVIPKDYKKALERIANENKEPLSVA